ncbi:MAG TPA: outer membrane beta-barrel protein [Chryseosolibacter sp.]
MKKILVMLAFVSSAFFAKAQTSSGQMMIGGALSFSSVNYDNNNGSDYSNFTLAPSFGYFVKDNFVVGASLSLGNSKSGTGAGQTTTSSFGVGPFARLYKFTSSEQFAFFGQAGLAFGNSKSETGNVITDKSNSITFSIAPGFAYFFNEHWAAELSIAGFRIQNSKSDNFPGNDRTSVTFDVSSFNPSLGLRYHFGN